MKPYGDEVLLKLDRSIRLAKRAQEDATLELNALTEEEIFDGVRHGNLTLHGTLISLTPQPIWGDGFLLPLPDVLVQVPRGKLQQDHNRQGHEEAMWIDEIHGITFGLTRLNHPLEASQVEAIGHAMTEQMRIRKKDAQWLHEETVHGDPLVMFYSESIQPSVRGIAYDIFFVTSVDGRLVTGNVRFPMEQLQIWRPITRAIFMCAQVTA
ncbi:hypothetical protein [Paenibacillus xylanexedens]|uniref:hypothetical protein n=1 Tax=Paenibacillus xylanexedens TaxID=528191 RepID=UPI0011A921F5|nr:hypothetical protein [Paenibacillus xylanexedens]